MHRLTALPYRTGCGGKNRVQRQPHRPPFHVPGLTTKYRPGALYIRSITVHRGRGKAGRGTGCGGKIRVQRQPHRPPFHVPGLSIGLGFKAGT